MVQWPLLPTHLYIVEEEGRRASLALPAVSAGRVLLVGRVYATGRALPALIHHWFAGSRCSFDGSERTSRVDRFTPTRKAFWLLSKTWPQLAVHRNGPREAPKAMQGQ
jgi:hypothetical protein